MTVFERERWTCFQNFSVNIFIDNGLFTSVQVKKIHLNNLLFSLKTFLHEKKNPRTLIFHSVLKFTTL